MKSKMYKVLSIFLLCVSLWSCNGIFDLKPETALDIDETYQNKFDADAAVIGIYGKFIQLAERHVVLNELRGDLLQITGNATSNSDLQEINYHHVSLNNTYADPRPYYEVILNCNDALKNFNRMLQENKLEGSDYNQRYSDIAALRSWIYFQLAIHFGEVPYVTDSFDSVEALSDQSKFPVYTLETMLDELILFMETLPSLDVYPANSSLMMNIDGLNTQKFFVDKRLLLGDLYLWKGNYTKAAETYKKIMESGLVYGEGERFFEVYRIAWAQPWSHEIGYNGAQTRPWEYEWIWDLPFHRNFGPANPFIRLFASIGGEYLLKPSKAIVDKWQSETRPDDTPVDPRAYWSYRDRLGSPVVHKYLNNFNPVNPYENFGNWFLARAALVHLRFAEAANRDQKHKLAYALLNNGVKLTYDPEPGVNNRDVTNIMRTFHAPPYDFDAREGTYPYFRGPWYRNVGIRGRAGVKTLDFSFVSDSTIAIENALIHEAALELAFEGHRWQDLLRISLRRNDPAFLANRVYEKLEKEGDPKAQEVRDRLLDRNNWFLPFRWE